MTFYTIAGGNAGAGYQSVSGSGLAGPERNLLGSCK